MESKIYNEEQIKEVEDVINDSPKLITIEFIKTENGIGCVMGMTKMVEKMIELSGKDADFMSNQLVSKLESVTRDVSEIFNELENDIFKNALSALEKEINSKNSN
ncbi:hypothetical protein [Longibaculum muris]|uniref:hypothetical protein n=1 Tax=Longibaculum muris TaxID=1796628 RepID=UPI0022E74247|nr:hypothetical protein [Longibaculum muris]